LREEEGPGRQWETREGGAGRLRDLRRCRPSSQMRERLHAAEDADAGVQGV
jgi:hypothetical protein